MLIARCIELMFRTGIFQMPITIHKCNNGFLFSRMKQSAAWPLAGDIAGTTSVRTVIIDRAGCRACYLRPACCFV